MQSAAQRYRKRMLFACGVIPPRSNPEARQLRAQIDEAVLVFVIEPPRDLRLVEMAVVA